MSNEAENATFNNGNTEGMTQIMNNRVETYTELKGSSDEPVDILTIDFPEGFTYDGGDLRFYFTCEGTRYNSGVYFEISSITGQAKQGRDDSNPMDEIELSTNIKLPVLTSVLTPRRRLAVM